jgi:cullin 1
VIEEETLKAKTLDLFEKEGSGCRVMLANDHNDDLGRMFRLFLR